MLVRTRTFSATMVKRCVAAGCCNTYGDGVSLFTFPKDPGLRAQWTKQVQRTRAEWAPTKYSVLCSDHFKADCFEIGPSIAFQLGIKRTRKLKPGAVPSIFVRPSRKRTLEADSEAHATRCMGEASSSKKMRIAYEKREKHRVSKRPCVQYALAHNILTCTLNR